MAFQSRMPQWAGIFSGITVPQQPEIAEPADLSARSKQCDIGRKCFIFKISTNLLRKNFPHLQD
jgi:hypothetical protein